MWHKTDEANQPPYKLVLVCWDRTGDMLIGWWNRGKDCWYDAVTMSAYEDAPTHWAHRPAPPQKEN